MAYDDILLLKLLKAGDEQAVRYLFDTYFVPLCRFGNLYLNNKEEAEEIALDLFTYLWEKRDTLHIESTFKAYLFQAMKNRCLNATRNRRETCPLNEVDDLPVQPHHDLEMSELTRLIEEAVCSLPEKCQEVYRRSREQDQTNIEIARSMDVSVKTVEAQITKALKKIKSHLSRLYAFFI